MSYSRRVTAALKDHPVLLRAVLLYYRDGLTQAKVAKRMKMSQPTVHRKIILALKILKNTSNLDINFSANRSI